MRKSHAKIALAWVEGRPARVNPVRAGDMTVNGGVHTRTGPTIETDGITVWLYGNEIVQRRFGKGYGVYVTLAGWNTPSTRAVINACMMCAGIPFSVSQASHEPVMRAPHGSALMPVSGWVKTPIDKDDAPQPITMMFRRYRGGDTIALMPYVAGDQTDPTVMDSYMHVGQHGGATMRAVLADTYPVYPCRITTEPHAVHKDKHVYRIEFPGQYDYPLPRWVRPAGEPPIHHDVGPWDTAVEAQIAGQKRWKSDARAWELAEELLGLGYGPIRVVYREPIDARAVRERDVKRWRSM